MTYSGTGTRGTGPAEDGPHPAQKQTSDDQEQREILEQRVRERTHQLATLAQVASQIAVGGSLQSTLDILCGHVVEATGAVAAAVALGDPTDGTGYMAGSYGLPEGYRPAMNRILASGANTLLQDAISQHTPAVSRNARSTLLQFPSYEPLHPYLRQVPWDTIVAVPMRYRGVPVGMLLSYHLPTAAIGEAEMALYAVVADLASVAVENSRLLAESQDKARLEERQRLARELHDSVSQALFSISLIARSAELVLQREGTHSTDALEKLADLRQLTAGALAEMRALIFELRPGALEEEGLVEALRKHAAAVQSREMIQVEVAVTSGRELPRLDPRTEEALYRVAQEALHNVAKHAKATTAAVSLTSLSADGTWIELRVTDNGTGFDPQRVPAGHMGLGTMRQRVEALGGQYSVQSGPGGTTVCVRVPLPGASS